MADIWSKRKRSEVMSLIRSRGNKDTELRLIVLFREFGITGWRRHLKLPGTPDFTFRKRRVVIFVDGCFWHGCPKHATFPVTRRAFWLEKFSRNQARDRLVTRTLCQQGWRVLRIWEHELARKREARLVARLRRAFER